MASAISEEQIETATAAAATTTTPPPTTETSNTTTTTTTTTAEETTTTATTAEPTLTAAETSVLVDDNSETTFNNRNRQQDKQTAQNFPEENSTISLINSEQLICERVVSADCLLDYTSAPNKIIISKIFKQEVRQDESDAEVGQRLQKQEHVLVEGDKTTKTSEGGSIKATIKIENNNDVQLIEHHHHHHHHHNNNNHNQQQQQQQQQNQFFQHQQHKERANENNNSEANNDTPEENLMDPQTTEAPANNTTSLEGPEQQVEATATTTATTISSAVPEYTILTPVTPTLRAPNLQQPLQLASEQAEVKLEPAHQQPDDTILTDLDAAQCNLQQLGEAKNESEQQQQRLELIGNSVAEPNLSAPSGAEQRQTGQESNGSQQQQQQEQQIQQFQQQQSSDSNQQQLSNNNNSSSKQHQQQSLTNSNLIKIEFTQPISPSQCPSATGGAPLTELTPASIGTTLSELTTVVPQQHQQQMHQHQQQHHHQQQHLAQDHHQNSTHLMQPDDHQMQKSGGLYNHSDLHHQHHLQQQLTTHHQLLSNHQTEQLQTIDLDPSQESHNLTTLGTVRQATLLSSLEQSNPTTIGPSNTSTSSVCSSTSNTGASSTGGQIGLDAQTTPSTVSAGNTPTAGANAQPAGGAAGTNAPATGVGGAAVAAAAGGGGKRRTWNQVNRNLNKTEIAKVYSPYGFRCYLETPISTCRRKEEDRITYINKGEFYGLSLEYIPDAQRPLRSAIVKTVVMLVFREEKPPEEDLKSWQFWHSRQHSAKQRILDADNKNHVNVINQIEEISLNAIAFYWNPLETRTAKLNVAIQCLSTDFSNQKGVKGLPLNLQVDIYDLFTETSTPVFRGYATLLSYCDKGAQRRSRDEERRALKRKLADSSAGSVNSASSGANQIKKFEDLYHKPCDRSEFYSMADLMRPPTLYTPSEADTLLLDSVAASGGLKQPMSQGSCVSITPISATTPIPATNRNSAGTPIGINNDSSSNAGPIGGVQYSSQQQSQQQQQQQQVATATVIDTNQSGRPTPQPGQLQATTYSIIPTDYMQHPQQQQQQTTGIGAVATTAQLQQHGVASMQHPQQQQHLMQQQHQVLGQQHQQQQQHYHTIQPSYGIHTIQATDHHIQQQQQQQQHHHQQQQQQQQQLQQQHHQQQHHQHHQHQQQHQHLNQHQQQQQQYAILQPSPIAMVHTHPQQQQLPHHTQQTHMIATSVAGQQHALSASVMDARGTPVAGAPHQSAGLMMTQPLIPGMMTAVQQQSSQPQMQQIHQYQPQQQPQQQQPTMATLTTSGSLPSMASGGQIAGQPFSKRAKLYPDERVLIYAKQADEKDFYPLHLSPPSLSGLVFAIEQKYKIDSTKVANIYKKSKKGIRVQMDDEMVRHYCNEDMVQIEVIQTSDSRLEITLVEL